MEVCTPSKSIPLAQYSMLPLPSHNRTRMQ
jgi:hypothetical protein